MDEKKGSMNRQKRWERGESDNERDKCGIQSTVRKEGREGSKKLVKYAPTRLVSSMGSTVF
jgi:hypothetical protein